MRVELTIEGGVAHFPGLSKPQTIDSEQMSESEAQELKGLLDAAGFFERSSQARPRATPGADYRQYTITVEEAGRRHTVRLSDPIDDPAMQRLRAFLEAKVKELRRRARDHPP